MSHLADVPGLAVGNATDLAARTGVTTVFFDAPAVCGVNVAGGAPGTRETDLLRPGNLNPGVDAVCLCGGSAFGLAAADGVQRKLHDIGRGFEVGPHKVPIVPAAVIFDLTAPPIDYRALGRQSMEAALAGSDRRIGTVGAGTNANTAGLKGGLGSASERVENATVGALVVVNAVGTATAADGPWFRAAPFERNDEFGGLTPPPTADFAGLRTKVGASAGSNTVIAIIATDAILTTAEAERLARSAHDGIT
ncbi:MAG: P1 family peptidase, partial [Pseudomonadota bacterium]